MPFASEDQVDLALKPYFGDMVSLVLKAHSDWATSPFAASMQAPKVRANLIWNQFLYHAKALFDRHDAVRVETKRHWEGLVVGDNFFVRMKKAGDRLLSQNYPTQAALKFNDATVDLFEGIVRLELLYTLNELETGIARIVIAQRHRNKVLWAIDLLDTAEDHGQTVINMPKAPTGGVTPADRVIKPKKNLEQQPKKDGTDNDGA
jgi:hypothetical protein